MIGSPAVAGRFVAPRHARRVRRSWWRWMAVVAVAAAAFAPGAAVATPARREARRAAESAPLPAAVPGPIVIRRGLLGRPRVIMAPGLVPVPGGVAAAPATPPPGARLPAAAAPGGPAAIAAKPPAGAGSATPPATAAKGSSPATPNAAAANTAAAATPSRTDAATPRAGAASPATSPAPTAAAVAAAQPPAPAAEAIPAPLPLPMKERAAPPVGDTDATPFSPAWLAAHPEAWRPRQAAAEWWKPADLDAVTAWLGQGVTRAGGAATAQGRVAAAGGAQDAAAVDADGLRSVLVLPTGRDEPAATASADEWLPLGVFAVVPPGGDAAANQQQILVDRTGTIRGNFHDPLSGTVQPVNGVVDLSTRTASWTVGTGGSRFECGLDAFAAASAKVVVTAGGSSRTLDLVPIPGLTAGR